MKILLIGGTGHVGQHMVPMLVQNGHQVAVVSRGTAASAGATGWDQVEIVTAQYKAGDSDWAKFIAAQNAEVIIDMLGADVVGTYAAAKNSCEHYLACGSLWMWGPPRTVPTPDETQNPCVFEGYASRYQQLQDLQQQAAREGFAFTAIMPPNICGPGKIPLDGEGGRSVAVHQAHAKGEAVTLPEGCNTLIGPCDAADIAKAFSLAVEQRAAAAGEIFNVGAAYALSATQLIETFGDIYHVNIPIKFVGWEQYRTSVLPDVGAHYHFTQHMCPDISKLRAKLGYEPAYTPQQTLERAINWMRKTKLM